MEKYLKIVVDTNDGDYITELNKISDDVFERIRPLINLIKNFEPYTHGKVVQGQLIEFTHTGNFPVYDCVREDLGQIPAKEYYKKMGVSEDVIEEFEEYIPYVSFHSIVSLELIEVNVIETLID
jgi:hypothetical protein